jgi:hypothetical protein
LVLGFNLSDHFDAFLNNEREGPSNVVWGTSADSGFFQNEVAMVG